ncbi:MAG TPA: hypothetical protein VFN92_07735 [Solirubrobacterales bacterium]|nr:hypothetical protein [Solirubrobacterales bacterium]
MRRITCALCLLAAIALVVAGCGGGDSTGGEGGYSGKGGGAYGGGKADSGKTTTASAEGGGAAVVKAAQVGDLGTVVVDAEGMTLYDFHKDEGGTSACYGACAAAWPPLLTDGEPKAEAGAVASQLGTTERKDGTFQVTYDGWPLYTYAGDSKPGEANGNDIDQFGAEWYALQPNGDEPED